MLENKIDELIAALDKVTAAILQASGSQPQAVSHDKKPKDTNAKTPQDKGTKAETASKGKESYDENEDDATEEQLRDAIVAVDKKVARKIFKKHGFKKLADVEEQDDKNELLAELLEAAEKAA